MCKRMMSSPPSMGTKGGWQPIPLIDEVEVQHLWGLVLRALLINFVHTTDHHHPPPTLTFNLHLNRSPTLSMLKVVFVRTPNGAPGFLLFESSNGGVTKAAWNDFKLVEAEQCNYIECKPWESILIIMSPLLKLRLRCGVKNLGINIWDSASVCYWQVNFDWLLTT